MITATKSETAQQPTGVDEAVTYLRSLRFPQGNIRKGAF